MGQEQDRTPTEIYLASRKQVDYVMPDGRVLAVSFDRDAHAPSWVSHPVGDGYVVARRRR